MAKRELIAVEGLADADLRELGENILLVRSGRSELQGEVETSKRLLVASSLVILGSR
jgi:hypothetical protein